MIFLFIFLIMLTGSVCAEPTEEALSLQQAFVDVSKEVGPAVVSISVEHIERYQTRYYPFTSSEDAFFRDFFSDFFVSGPEKEFKRLGLGSGVLIDKEGYVLTNDHVVQGADRIKVTLSDGREFEGQLTGSDVYSDLAVIKIDPQGDDLPIARLGDSDKVQIGEWAIAIGNPFAFAVKDPQPTLTVGVISALHRSLPRTDRRIREYSDLIQTDAAINPGNSGGPLLNIRGEIIGINVAIFTLSGGSEGVGFAVPINTAKKIMSDLIEGREVLHGWIGVIIQDVDADIAQYFGLKESRGILISRIVEKSPAEKAGLKSGDVIVSFDDKNIRNTQELIRYVLKKNVGDKVDLNVIRNGVKYSIQVEIAARPGEGMAGPVEKKEEKAPPAAKDIERWRGIEISGITPEITERYGFSVESGVIITSVEPGSPAQNAGLRRGDIIYEINRKGISGKADYNKVVASVSGDVLIGTYRGYVIIKEE